MSAPGQARDFRRHLQAAVELIALALCSWVVSTWVARIPVLQLVPSLLLLLVWPPTLYQRPGEWFSRAALLRIPVIAAANFLGCYFFTTGTHGLAFALGAWSALAVAWSLVAVLRFVPRERPATGRYAIPPRFRPVLLSFVLPVALAWGATTALHHVVYPAAVRGPKPARNDYGPVRLHLKLPGTSEGIPEPILVCGTPGKASMIYIRLLPGGRAKIGVEFWGLELNQGPEFSLPAADAEIAVVCELPALFPPPDNTRWDQASAELRQQRSHRFRVTVDGIVQLEGTVAYEQPRHSPLYFGANPLGGSFISSKFTGTVLQATQAP